MGNLLWSNPCVKVWHGAEGKTAGREQRAADRRQHKDKSRRSVVRDQKKIRGRRSEVREGLLEN